MSGSPAARHRGVTSLRLSDHARQQAGQFEDVRAQSALLCSAGISRRASGCCARPTMLTQTTRAC